MKLLTIVLTLLLVFGASDAQRRRNRKGRKGNLSCHLKDIEKCLDTLAALGNNDNPTSIIATSQGLDKFCGTVRNKFAGCVRDYFKKCGTPLHRELSGLVMDQMLSHTTDMCNKGPKREKFLKSSPCLHEKVFTQKPYKEDCNNRYVSTLNKASKNARNDSLPGICCGFRYWEECTAKLVQGQCGETGMEAFNFIIKKAFLDLPNLTCPKDIFKLESDECKSNLAPKGKKASKLNVGDSGIGKYNVANMFSWMFQVE